MRSTTVVVREDSSGTREQEKPVATTAHGDDAVLAEAVATASLRRKLVTGQLEAPQVAACPVGYYRSSLMVFECSGGNGQAHVILPPPNKVVEVQEIPAGIRDFKVTLLADVRTRMLLWDREAAVDVMQRLGAVSGGMVGDYRGLHITSGDDQVHKTLQLKGTVQVALSLRVLKYVSAGAGMQDRATLQYTYGGLSACPVAPQGCEQFDRPAAEKAVKSWSQALQARYHGSHEAWVGETKELPVMPNGIPWHEWVVVWHFAATWQIAFRFLDMDGNQLISPLEFAQGFRASQPATPQPLPATPPPTTQPPAPTTAALPTPQLAAPAVGVLSDRCPAGYYRSSALLFSCNGGKGSVHFVMPPSRLEEATDVPKGVQNLKMSLSTDVDVDMYLWDPSSTKYIVHWKDGVVNDQLRTGSYKGMKLSFSGDDRTTPIRETCNLTGTVPTSIVVRLFNYAKDRATATFHYSYAGYHPCSAVPSGCRVYDRVQAEHAATRWASRIRRRFKSATEAWNTGHASEGWSAGPDSEQSPQGITWHDWVARPEDQLEQWKMVFRFLDVDNDGHISNKEFSRGYTFGQTQGGGSVSTTTSSRTVVPLTCPDGSYRTAALVLGCSGGSGTAHWTLGRKGLYEVQQIPVGLTDLTISLSAPEDVDLFLWDQAFNQYILHWRKGVVNDRQRSGRYRGLRVSFSGDDKRPPTRETYSLKGKVPVPISLRLQNFGKAQVEVTLKYEHGKVIPCPAVPVGCSPFDLARAEQAALDWSRRERARHPTAQLAWAAYPAAVDGITWHEWEAVAKDLFHWKIAFRYLDTNNDGRIHREEFMTGYHFGKRQPISTTTAVAAPVTTLAAARQPSDSTAVVTCPAGYFQSREFLFGCSGGNGTIEFTAAPGQVDEALHIPRGVRDVALSLSANVDFDLFVWDNSARRFLVNWEDGVVSEKVRKGLYRGLSVTFSGDDRTPLITEDCKLMGTLSMPLSVRLHNHGKVMATATLRYTYSGFSPCEAVPNGCSLYNAQVARRTAAVCARQFRTDYPDKESAWAALIGLGRGPCLRRQRWRAACKNVDTAAAQAFRYVDENSDGCISKSEFFAAYNSGTAGTREKPVESLKVSFQLPNLDYGKLSSEPDVKFHLEEAVRVGVVSACNDAGITQNNVRVDLGMESPQHEVEASIVPPMGKGAESIKKYCCSPTWLNANIPEHVAGVTRVHQVLRGRINNFAVSCKVYHEVAAEIFIPQHLGPVEAGLALALLGSTVFAVSLFYLVNRASSNTRLHAWALIGTGTCVFAASLVFAAVRDFVDATVAFAPLPVHIYVDYGLFMCGFAILQATNSLLLAGLSSGGPARGGAGATAPLDEQVWVIADPARADCGEKIHSHEVLTKDTSRSIASIHGHEVCVRKAWYERDQEVRRIRSYTGFISHVAGFGAIYAGCEAQRLALESRRPGIAVVVPVFLNQVLLFSLFRAAQALRPSARVRLAAGTGSSGLLHDPRRVALLDEEIHGAESDIASLACSFLLVQALQYWISGVVPSLDNMEEEFVRPIKLVGLLGLVGAGVAFALFSAALAYLSTRPLLVAWKRRLTKVYANMSAMSSAWCILWAAQWALHRLDATALFGVPGELAGQLFLALAVSFASFAAVCLFGRVQDTGGPETLAGAIPAGVAALGVLAGVSWRLAFGVAAAAVAEGAPQPLITRLLFSVALALLVLPALNRVVLKKVLWYRQLQADVLQARGHSALADDLGFVGMEVEDRPVRRDVDRDIDSSFTPSVWRFHHRQDDWPEDRTPGGSKAKLEVTMMNAKNLRNADYVPFTGNKSDPFCTCEVLGKPSSKIQTPTVDNDLNPVWNYTAEIMDYDEGDSLLFTVYDEDMTKQDLLGRATLTAGQMYPSGFEGELPLLDAGKADAVLVVRVTPLRPAISSFQLQFGKVQPAPASGWYVDPNGKELRPLG